MGVATTLPDQKKAWTYFEKLVDGVKEIAVIDVKRKLKKEVETSADCLNTAARNQGGEEKNEWWKKGPQVRSETNTKSVQINGTLIPTHDRQEVCNAQSPNGLF